MNRLLLILVLAAIAAPAAAQERKPPVSLPAVDFAAEPATRQKQAAIALKAWLEAASKDSSAFPRAGDPGMPGELVRAAFDKSAIAATPDEPMALDALCSSASQALSPYLRQGIPPDAGTPGKPLTQEQAQRADANTMAYQDEATLGMDFTLDCTARLSRLATRVWTAMPPTAKADANRIQSLRQMQALLFNLYRGAMGTIANPLYGAPMRTTISESLVRNAETYAGFLTLEQRKVVRDVIDQLLKTADPGAKATLTQVRTAMDDLGCTGACAS